VPEDMIRKGRGGGSFRAGELGELWDPAGRALFDSGVETLIVASLSLSFSSSGVVGRVGVSGVGRSVCVDMSEVTYRDLSTLLSDIALLLQLFLLLVLSRLPL